MRILYLRHSLINKIKFYFTNITCNQAFIIKAQTLYVQNKQASAIVTIHFISFSRIDYKS